MDTTRPAWMPAQVTVESNKPFHIIMEGQATNGGFAVDDIIFTPGSCPSKIYIILFKNIIIILTLGRYLLLTYCTFKYFKLQEFSL